MKRARIYKRSNGWYLHPISTTTAGVGMGTPPRIKVAFDAPSDVLGNAVFEALNASVQNIPHPPLAELEDRFKPVLELAGVKSWAAFARDASSVAIEADTSNEWLIIEAWSNAGPKMGFAPMLGAFVRVRMDAPPAEIGEAINKAMQLSVPQPP